MSIRDDRRKLKYKLLRSLKRAATRFVLDHWTIGDHAVVATGTVMVLGSNIPAEAVEGVPGADPVGQSDTTRLSIRVTVAQTIIARARPVGRDR